MTPEKPLWRRSATQLAAAIRVGETCATEVVSAFLQRIDEVNPAVNAATVVFHDRALVAADEADAQLRSGAEAGPLHGVPISVKENVDLTWSATTNGLPLLHDAIPEHDSTDVARLRAAGAIPIIRTNMPDLGMRWHTDNDLVGPTINPWNPARTPGGSSGGEGVAIAVGMSPLGVGNDFAGSVRLPAHANGVCGLKPTPGRIPIWSPGPGVFPPSGQLFAVQGPLGRTVEDVATAYSVMRGVDGVDPLAVPVVDDPYPDAPRRAAVVLDPGGEGIAPSVRAAVTRAAEALARAGWEIAEIEPPSILEAARLWRELAVNDLLEHLFAPEVGLAQHCSEGTQRHTEQLAAHTRRLTLGEYSAALSRRIEIVSDWGAFSRRFPIIIAPVTTDLPFEVGDDIAGPDAVDEIWHSHRMLVAPSCLGLPSLAVPLGTQTSGMPEGVQLIGPRFGEWLCLAAGRDLEHEVGAMDPIDPRPAPAIHRDTVRPEAQHLGPRRPLGRR